MGRLRAQLRQLHHHANQVTKSYTNRMYNQKISKSYMPSNSHFPSHTTTCNDMDINLAKTELPWNSDPNPPKNLRFWTPFSYIESKYSITFWVEPNPTEIIMPNLNIISLFFIFSWFFLLTIIVIHYIESFWETVYIYCIPCQIRQ